MFGAMLFFGIGLLWAPFAALLTYRAASRQRLLSPRRYAVLGGVYSTLCIFLWLNLMAGMRKGNWNHYKTGALYIALFLIWFGLILMAIFQIGTTYIDSGRDEYYWPVSLWTFSTIGAGVFTVIALPVSAKRFWDSRASILADDGPSIPLDGLLPFGLALLSTVATIVNFIGFEASYVSSLSDMR